MKLITLNVALFEPNNPLVSRFLKKEKPDIACFQEVTRGLYEGVDEQFVSKMPLDEGTSDLKYGFFGLTNVFGEVNMNDFHGKENFHFDPKGLLEMGNYTKSRYRIIRAQSVFLEGHFTYETSSDKWPGEQSRAIVVTEFAVSGEIKLTVINYHGIWTRDKMGNDRTVAACNKILDRALESSGNTIICGDFNLYPDTPSIKVFEKHFVNLVDKYDIKTTRPSSNELHGNGRNVVDYVFVDPKIEVNSFTAVNNDVSDHLPLVLEFDL